MALSVQTANAPLESELAQGVDIMEGQYFLLWHLFCTADPFLTYT